MAPVMRDGAGPAPARAAGGNEGKKAAGRPGRGSRGDLFEELGGVDHDADS